MIDTKISILKREYYTMSRIPKPKPATVDPANMKIEDIMNNKTLLEEMIVNFKKYI